MIAVLLGASLMCLCVCVKIISDLEDQLAICRQQLANKKRGQN